MEGLFAAWALAKPIVAISDIVPADRTSVVRLDSPESGEEIAVSVIECDKVDWVAGRNIFGFPETIFQGHSNFFDLEVEFQPVLQVGETRRCFLNQRLCTLRVSVPDNLQGWEVTLPTP